jgi:hypothetical protein
MAVTDAEKCVMTRQSFNEGTAVVALTDSSTGTVSNTILLLDETIGSVDVAAAGPTEVVTAAAYNTEAAKMNDNNATLASRISALEVAILGRP